jgi:rhodanese-related sulfurtransferase
MGKWLIIALAIPILFLLLRSRATADGAIGPAESADWIKERKDLQLIDVRTEGEYTDGHLAGAKLIPVQDIRKRMSEIDKNKPVLLYCRSGNRSGTALKALIENGYTEAKHMAGGIAAWTSSGLPVSR